MTDKSIDKTQEEIQHKENKDNQVNISPIKITDHIKNKFKTDDLKKIGYGTYSKVYDIGNGLVFKKILAQYYDDDDENFHFQGISHDFLKEITCLKTLGKISNIVELKDVIIENNIFGYTMKKYEGTLMQYFEKNKKTINLENINKIIYQLLSAVSHIHYNFIVHQDIKPTNILVDKNDNYYLCDWSLIRFEYSYNTTGTDDNVQTIWYRAPEVLLGKSYNAKVDIWSIGIILLELLYRRTGLIGANTEKEQMKKYIHSFGYPEGTVEEINLIKKEYEIQDNNIFGWEKFKSSFEKSKIPEEYYNLLKEMLNYNPNKRPHAYKLMENPIFKKYHDNREEINDMNIYFNTKIVDKNKIKENCPWLSVYKRCNIMAKFIKVSSKYNLSVIETSMMIHILDCVLESQKIEESEINIYQLIIVDFILKIISPLTISIRKLSEELNFDESKYSITTIEKMYMERDKIVLSCIEYNIFQKVPLLIINNVLNNKISPQIDYLMKLIALYIQIDLNSNLKTKEAINVIMLNLINHIKYNVCIKDEAEKENLIDSYNKLKLYFENGEENIIKPITKSTTNRKIIDEINKSLILYSKDNNNNKYEISIVSLFI